MIQRADSNTEDKPVKGKPSGSMHKAGADATPNDWRKQYDIPGYADYYAQKRDESFLKKLSNRFELNMVRHALRRLSTRFPVQTSLDLPTGTGRFLPVISEFSGDIIAMDASPAMVSRLQLNDSSAAPNTTPPKIARCVGSVFEIPLPDDHVDIVLCSRLIHHLPDAAARLSLFSELARVARYGMVVTFFDAGSYCGMRRNARAKRKQKLNTRHAISRKELIANAKSNGLTFIGANALLRFHTEITAASFTKDR